MKSLISFVLIAVCLLAQLVACDDKNPEQEPDGADELTHEEKFDINDDEISTFTNPIQSVLKEGETWPGYGTGDPFVMRYNGVYYLYVSSKDNYYPGIKCWTSKNLVDWEYKGYCVQDMTIMSAYAPEVYYYNGNFYMYTSPAGDGHYVLKSSSPTGPFKVITENLGKSIDGSVLITQDGEWYFYTAGGSGIVYYEMTSPSNIKSSKKTIGAYMNGWTEGSMIVYHDGTYFLTYTGNHVWSKSYRINYAVSKNPLSFAASDENPLLVSTNDEIFGIGHSSTVKGPDLDGYYIVYHSINEKVPQRQMSIDRIYFNGRTMQVVGPTVCDQQTPLYPDIYSFFDSEDDLKAFSGSGASYSSKRGDITLAKNSQIISNSKISSKSDRFTMELSVSKISDGGKAGAIFGYTDENNYGKALFDPASQKLVVTIFVNGEKTEKSFDFVKCFNEDLDFNYLHTMQIEKNGSTFIFYANDIELGRLESSLSCGAVGCVTEGASARFGYIGACDEYGGSGLGDVYKNVSSDAGEIYAVYCSNDKIETVMDDGENCLVAEAGKVYNYRILAEEDGIYDVCIEYSASSDTEIAFYINGKIIENSKMTLKKTDGFGVATCKLTLPKGKGTLSVEIISGGATMRQYNILLSAKVEALNITYDSIEDGNVYSDGTWTVSSGKISVGGETKIGKRLYGNENWDDYVVEVEVTPTDGINCGLLVRAINPGNTVKINEGEPTKDHLSKSSDFVQGYFVGINADKLVLGKQNYSWTELESVKGNYSENKTYKIKVECVGANIKVYVDGELKIDYTDTENPWIQGMVGIRTHSASAKFDNLSVKPVE